MVIKFEMLTILRWEQERMLYGYFYVEVGEPGWELVDTKNLHR